MSAEKKLKCGCYVGFAAGTWRVTGSAFTCPDKHGLYDVLAPELVEQESEAERIPDRRWRGVYPGYCINPDTCFGHTHCPRVLSCVE